jgi:NADPH-dependent curcumin reductase CurA
MIIRDSAIFPSKGNIHSRTGNLGKSSYAFDFESMPLGSRIADGRIRYRDEIVDHLEKTPEALIRSLDGHNFGKAMMRVAD